MKVDEQSVILLTASEVTRRILLNHYSVTWYAVLYWHVILSLVCCNIGNSH